MQKISLDSIIDFILFLYILSLYLLTYGSDTHAISNAIAFVLVVLTWMRVLLLRKRIVFNKLLFAYLLFIIIGLISVFYAINQSYAVTKVKTLSLIFIVMISLVNYLDNKMKLRKVIKYFVFSGLLASIYILINSDFSQITRFGTELGNVNVIGMIIGISVTLCFYIIFDEKKYIYILPVMIMCITILLTGSRKALLFITMNIIFILFLKYRNSMKTKLKFILNSILIILIIYYLIFNIPFFYQIIGHRIENMLEFLSGKGSSEGSINSRIHMIQVGIEVFKYRPLTGYGLDNYRVIYNMFLGGRETFAHNNYIELLVDIGIIGLLIYYFTHIIVLKDLYKGYKQNVNQENNTIYTVFMAIIVSYIILSTTLVYYDSKQFSFLLAIASVIYRNNKLMLAN